jgi:hypothetical protein
MSSTPFLGDDASIVTMAMRNPRFLCIIQRKGHTLHPGARSPLISKSFIRYRFSDTFNNPPSYTYGGENTA